jgi:hypothetical protein
MELYARHREQEVFYRKLKLQVARSGLLQSHTPETAQQEIAALLMACTLVAQERLEVTSQGLMNEAAQVEQVRWMRAQIAACALPPGRARSCERKVRLPVNKWPRMLSPTSLTSPAAYQVTNIA